MCSKDMFSVLSSPEKPASLRPQTLRLRPSSHSIFSPSLACYKTPANVSLVGIDLVTACCNVTQQHRLVWKEQQVPGACESLSDWSLSLSRSLSGFNSTLHSRKSDSRLTKSLCVLIWNYKPHKSHLQYARGVVELQHAVDPIEVTPSYIY